MSIEKSYQPSEDEVKKAEEEMTSEQEELSEQRLAEIRKAEDFAREIMEKNLRKGVLISTNFHMPIEIDPESRSPRLDEFLLWIEQRGPAKKWEDLKGLNITEEDFADVGEHTDSGKLHLMVDNSGTISVMMKSRWINTGIEEDENWLKATQGENEFNWGKRPKLGDAHFDYSDTPEWLKNKFNEYWEQWRTGMIAYYEAKEKSTDRFAWQFD